MATAYIDETKKLGDYTTTGNAATDAANRQKALDILNKSGSSYSVTTPTLPSTITSSNLAPTTPFTLSPNPVPTSAIGLSAELSSNINSEVQNQATQDEFTKNLNEKAAATESAATSAFNRLKSFLGSRKGETALTDEAYTTKNDLGTTVDETAKLLRATNAKINAVDIRANAQIKELQKNAGGLFGGALEQEIQNVQRQAAADKADLYIDKLVQQGDYETARSIADRKVDILLEKDKMDLEKLQLDYETNKDLFTKAEQRQFETAQGDRERKLEETKTTLKTISDLSLNALQNGAPPIIASQMRAAKTVDEALRIGGQYIDSLDRRTKEAALANTYSLIKERNATSNGLKPATQEQNKVAGFADRISQSNRLIDEIGANFTGAKSYVGQLVPNVFKSEDRQKFEQAQRNFINAVLRRESGAVISPEEFSNARQQYFPQPGDTPGVLAQKAQNRQTVLNSFIRESGNALSQGSSENDPLGLFN